MEVFHFAASAAQKQYNQQNPSAVATAKATAFFATATAVAVVKQSVEHSFTSFSPKLGTVLTFAKSISQYGK